MTSPVIVSAYNVTFQGFYGSGCGLEVDSGTFDATYNCVGFDIWPLSSYKLYYTGQDDCPEGKSLQIKFYEQEGDGTVCGTGELAVVTVGDSQDCVEGLNISPASAEVTCA